MQSLPVPESTCAGCGTPFHCGRDDPAGCWCARLPALEPARYAPAFGCLCSACLAQLLEAAGAPSRG